MVRPRMFCGPTSRDNIEKGGAGSEVDEQFAGGGGLRPEATRGRQHMYVGRWERSYSYGGRERKYRYKGGPCKFSAMRVPPTGRHQIRLPLQQLRFPAPRRGSTSKKRCVYYSPR